MERSLTCPSCSRDVYADDAFCSSCGVRLQARSVNTGLSRRTLVRSQAATNRYACASCNSPLLPTDVYCAACGARHGAASQESPSDAARASNIRNLEGATRGKFEFIRELGRGGMGSVYLAREIDLDRLVAIKVLSSSWLTDEAMVERFRREARTIASLRHPSIVHVHGVGQLGEINYFIMDFIDGISLGGILRVHGRLSVAVSQAVFYQVGAALSYAHRPSRGVIHRDIKPSNIMVDVEGNSFVTDFGISKVMESHSGLTMTGLIMGTPEYMSPEQCRGDTVTQASDQYALGAVMYAMLTGAPPFTGPNYRVLVGHTTEPPVPLLDLRPDCPREVADAVMRMLSKTPGERWPDIKDAFPAMGGRPLLADDPVRDELLEIVALARGIRSKVKPGAAPELRESTSVRTPTSLRIAAVPQSLETGDEIELRATGVFSDGQEEQKQEVSWHSADPSIVRIDSTTGRLVAVGIGSAVITARAAGVAESVAVEVGPPRVARLTIVPEVVEMEVGETEQLTPEPRSRRGQVLERKVLWSSSDPQTVSVSEHGVARAHKTGVANLLAHCDGVGATAAARVVPAHVASVHLPSVPPSIEIGATASLRAEPRDARGARLERAVEWSSSDATVARIGADGVVHGLRAGTVQVMATCEGQKTASSVAVVAAKVARIAIVEPRDVLVVGERVRFAAVTHDARGRPLKSEIRWSSGDKAVLAAEENGWFRGVRPGRTTVLAVADEATARVGVEVRAVPVAKLASSVPPAGLVAGDTFHLQATPMDERGREMREPVTWAVDNAAVIESLGSGLFRALAPGPANVTAQSGDATTRFSLVVGELRAASLSIEPLMQPFRVDDIVQLAASLRDQRGGLLNHPVQWSSSDPFIARVSSSGMLTGAAPGTATITAECEGARDSLVVSVVASDWVTMVHTPVVRRREDRAPSAAARSDAGDAVVAETTVVDPATPVRRTGRRTQVLVGVAAAAAVGVMAWWAFVLRPRPSPASEVVTDPVPPPVPVSVAAIRVSTARDSRDAASGLRLTVGDTVSLAARPEDGEGRAIPDIGVSWSSTDSALASIDATGKLTARARGSVRIVAAAGAITSSVPVVLEPRPVDPPPVVAGQPGGAGVRRGTPAGEGGRGGQPPPADTAGQGRRTAAPPEPDGILRLIVVPWARVLIDGEARGDEVQRLEVPLRPGSRRLQLENPNMVPVDTTITIRAGEATPLRFQLRPRS